MGEPRAAENAGKTPPASQGRFTLRELNLNNPTTADKLKPIAQVIEEAKQARQERQKRESK